MGDGVGDVRAAVDDAVGGDILAAPEVVEGVKTGVVADDIKVGIKPAGEEVAQKGRQLEVEGVFAAAADLVVFDIRFTGEDLLVHLKA